MDIAISSRPVTQYIGNIGTAVNVINMKPKTLKYIAIYWVSRGGLAVGAREGRHDAPSLSLRLFGRRALGGRAGHTFGEGGSQARRGPQRSGPRKAIFDKNTL